MIVNNKNITDPASIFKSHFLISIIIFLLVIAVFSEVLTADFVEWDDNIIIYLNPNIGNLSMKRVSWAFTDVDSMMRYNPLTLLSWCATYQIFGFNPYGYHLGNLLLHALSSFTLFFIIRILLILTLERKVSQPFKHISRINFVAAIATLFWALHPMRVEPVAWATDRTYCQATFFLLVSTLFYLKAKCSNIENTKYKIYIVLSFILYVFSLLSYAIGITYVVVFFLFDYFLFFKKGRDQFKIILWEKIVFLIPAFFIALITVIVRIKSAGAWISPVPLSQFSILSRIMQAIYIFIYYIYRPFYPINLSPVYTVLVSFDPLSFYFLFRAAILIVISAVVFMVRNRCRLPMILFIAHIVLLVPVSGFFEHPHYPVDRYSLLSSICISLFVAFFLISMSNTKKRIIFSTVFVLMICSFGWLSFKQVKIWNNSESLFKHMIKTLNDDPYVHDIYWRLGVYLYKKKRTGEAEINFKKTLKINPYHIISRKFLGIIEYEKGNYDTSISQFLFVLKMKKNDPQALYYLSRMKALHSKKK